MMEREPLYETTRDIDVHAGIAGRRTRQFIPKGSKVFPWGVRRGDEIQVSFGSRWGSPHWIEEGAIRPIEEGGTT